MSKAIQDKLCALSEVLATYLISPEVTANPTEHKFRAIDAFINSPCITNPTESQVVLESGLLFSMTNPPYEPEDLVLNNVVPMLQMYVSIGLLKVSEGVYTLNTEIYFSFAVNALNKKLKALNFPTLGEKCNPGILFEKSKIVFG